MAEMDPIVREALKRSSQMQGNIPQRRNSHPKKPKEEREKTEEINHDIAMETPKQQEKNENTLDMLLKNKDQSLIFLLIVLLMSEDSDPTLLLALMYLLI